MADAVERSGVKFMTGQVSRKNHANEKLKEIIDSGILGEIFYFEGTYAHDYEYLDAAWRRYPVKLRHGIIGGGCHAIELLRWMIGNPTNVTAFANKKVLTDWPVDDTTMAIMQLPNGAVGKIFCSIGGKKPNMLPISIFGTRGTAVVHNSNSGEIHLYRHVLADNGQHMYPETLIKVEALDHNVAAEIKEMVDCIVNDKRPECDVYEGAKTVAIGLAAIESSANGGAAVEPRYIERKN
jgi:predicted dehydrogenase